MKKKLWSKTLIFLNLICFFIIINPINIMACEKMKFKNITIEDGLSQASAEVLLQDSNGYIWIGTNDGLNRYNGYDFKTYKKEVGNKNSLVNNYIIDIKEDLQGNIWVGTINGISKIDIETDMCTNFTSDTNIGNLSHNNISEILVTTNGKILVGTIDGVNIYSEDENKFIRILDKELSSQFIYSMDEDEQGNIWIGTAYGLNKLDIKSNEVEKYFHDEENLNSISSNNVYEVYCDKNNIVWIGTSNKGISKIDNSTGVITRYEYNPEDRTSVPSDFIRDFLRDRNDRLWIATSEGLSLYDEKKDVFYNYKSNGYDKYGLVSEDVFSIIEDNLGCIWVGTNGGISYFDPNNSVEHYAMDPYNDNSLADNMVQGIYEDEDGLIWVGTSSKGISVIDRENDKIYNINNKNQNILSNDGINDITGFKELIFIGTDNGLTVIDKKNNRKKHYNINDGLSDKNVSVLYFDSKKNLWVGTANGLNIIDIYSDKIYDITWILEENNFKDNYIGSIYEDGEGNYWIGSFVDSGVLKIDNITKQTTHYISNGSVGSINSNSIRVIDEDEKGNLWFGTNLGIKKFDKETGEFKSYTTLDGLANDTIYGILFDENGRLWASTNLGISILNIQNDKIVNLNVAYGLQCNEFNRESYHKGKNGELFFGGINGLNIFNIFKVNDLPNANKSTDIVLDSFEVNGSYVKNLNGKTLNSNENNISISVFLPDYKNMKNIKYFYSIEDGTNSNWRLMKKNVIDLTNLSPGKYTIRIKARNIDGEMSNEKKIEFTIKVPFWRSGKAVLFYILVIIIVFFNNKYKIKRMDEIVEKRTKDLNDEMNKSKKLLNKIIDLEKKKNNYFINLSHELRTPLNVLHTTEQLITSLNNSNNLDKDKLNYYMEIIRNNNSRLLKLINNLIDTSKIENGSYKLNVKEENIVEIVEDAALTLKDYIENKGIQLLIDPEIEEKIIQCDATEIERCIVNLVGNAMKFTKPGGSITVNIKDLNDKVRIEVKDTGVGISKEYHDVIFDRFNQIVDQHAEIKGSGLGLTITKNIIELHSGNIYVESELGKGSNFIIELPVNIEKNINI